MSLRRRLLTLGIGWMGWISVLHAFLNTQAVCDKATRAANRGFPSVKVHAGVIQETQNGDSYEYHSSRLPRSVGVGRRDQLPPWVAQRRLDFDPQQLSLARPAPNAGSGRVARHLQPHASHYLRGAQSRQNL